MPSQQNPYCKTDLVLRMPLAVSVETKMNLCFTCLKNCNFTRAVAFAGKWGIRMDSNGVIFVGTGAVFGALAPELAETKALMWAFKQTAEEKWSDILIGDVKLRWWWTMSVTPLAREIGNPATSFWKFMNSLLATPGLCLGSQELLTFVLTEWLSWPSRAILVFFLGSIFDWRNPFIFTLLNHKGSFPLCFVDSVPNLFCAEVSSPKKKKKNGAVLIEEVCFHTSKQTWEEW